MEIPREIACQMKYGTRQRLLKPWKEKQMQPEYKVVLMSRACDSAHMLLGITRVQCTSPFVTSQST